ncbi:hypothetical protein X798_02616 [Onchocerca flexuosa]|uniref:Uncharacterized protein n=1 Tax=Onchocerca flexuosa TaxID=387005 RepID=A0A238BYN8_9BILA|nr:hypothetical protein X798_02616 [Onchocerca flexuosa]
MINGSKTLAKITTLFFVCYIQTPIKCFDRSCIESIGSLNADTTLIGIPANFHCQEAVKLKPFAENCAEMATSDVVMEADSGFVRNVRSPGSSDLVIKVNGKDVNRYDEEPEEIVGEGLFSFDEDVVPEKETGNSNEQSAVFDLFCDIQSDECESSLSAVMIVAHLTFSGGGASMTARIRHIENLWVPEKSTYIDLHTSSVELEEDGESEPIKRTGSLAYGTSLPITIPSGRFWPPRNAVDSIEDREILDFGENRELIDKTILPQRPPKDLYSEMRAQARSIQAVDDPERLFGERPSRRRYQTGEGRVTSQVTVPLQTFCEDATAAAAADVGEQTSY